MLGRYFFITITFTFCLFFLGISSEASPNSKYFLKNSGRFSDWERERIENFLREAEARLPYILKSNINGIIPVEFVEFASDRKQGLKSILIPSCQIQTGSEKGKSKTQEFGRANLQTNLIEINRLFLNEILLGAENSKTFQCRHRNLYHTAMAVLIHETGHLFDREVQVSSSTAFQGLMGFKAPWLFGEAQSKNMLATRSADPYEFTNLIEAFAVNLEYFLLDPEFACRRPVINHYYEQLLMMTLNPVANCKTNYEVSVKDSINGGVTRFDLDPSRLYSVDYLLADSGTQLMSYWGHSMFNFVYCAPGVPVGPKCREGGSLNHHVVVSFRANLTDLKLSYLKGIFGGYPSQPFLLTMTSVIREYNRLEKRNLESIPLNLTTEQKKNFVGQALEMYSSYMGEFRFLTNNCATETKDMIKAVVHNDAAQDLGFSTPKGLLKDLIAAGLIRPDYKKIEYGHFEAYSEKYRGAYDKLSTQAKKIKLSQYKIDDFIELTAAQRKKWYERVINTSADKKAYFVLALQVEQEIKELEKQSLDKFVLQIVSAAVEKPSSFDKRFSQKARSTIKSISENIKRTERFNANSVGYGVFLPEDNRDGAFEQAMAEITQRQLIEDLTFVRTEAEKMVPGLAEEIKATAKNIDWLIQSIRQK